MYSLIPVNGKALVAQEPIGRPPLRRALFCIGLALAGFVLSPTGRAAGVYPLPDGGYPGGNTAEGDRVLLSLTTGHFNTAIGERALRDNTTGSSNTANGANALLSNTTGSDNTADGFSALKGNTTGTYNTANGVNALQGNTTGNDNTANGVNALQGSNTGNDNTANGFSALFGNTTGTENTATGVNALLSNTAGDGNTADGVNALKGNVGGLENTACGAETLRSNTFGNNNIALGILAGSQITGNFNIDIGNDGVSGESNTIRIGTPKAQTNTFIAGITGVVIASGSAVIVDADGRLGTNAPSSKRFKEEIKPMDKASEAILALQPVTFHYKKELDPKGIPQFGLVAEQVEMVNPGLIGRDAEGRVNSVRYEAINAMLLNEFLKEHRTVQGLKSMVEKQEATIAQQQKAMELLAASLKEQASQIRKVNLQLEASKAAPQMVVNNQ